MEENPRHSEAISFALTRLGYDAIRDQQREALHHFLNGKDVFVSLPTGYGKSLIYQAAPFVSWYNNRTDSPDENAAIAIVISPLTSLIQDQVRSLQGKGIHAIHLQPSDLKTPISSQLCALDASILFCSPETLISRDGMNFISSLSQQICGLFVDESHCISTWGYGAKETHAFREVYAELGDLRSCLSSKTPVVTLTATATMEVREQILHTLGMTSAEVIEQSPNVPNIRYSVMPCKSSDVLVEWLFSELVNGGEKAEKKIVYFQSRKSLQSVYRSLHAKLRRQDPTLLASVGTYHGNTDINCRMDILTEFSNSHGSLKILFATVAFGMGVDVKCLHQVIHFGPPSTLDAYTQETGRAGRDGTQSHACLLLVKGPHAPRMPCMQRYIDQNNCRRQVIINLYPAKKDSYKGVLPKHLCCDICEKSCQCGNCVQLTSIEKALSNMSSDLNRKAKRIVDETQRESIKEKLQELHEQIKLSETKEDLDKVFSGNEITSKLPRGVINVIMENVELVITRTDLEKFSMVDNQTLHAVFSIICEISPDIDSLDDLETESISSDSDYVLTDEEQYEPADILMDSD